MELRPYYDRPTAILADYLARIDTKIKDSLYEPTSKQLFRRRQLQPKTPKIFENSWKQLKNIDSHYGT